MSIETLELTFKFNKMNAQSSILKIHEFFFNFMDQTQITSENIDGKTNEEERMFNDSAVDAYTFNK